MKNSFSAVLATCFALCLLSLSACTEEPSVATESSGTSLQQGRTLSGKPSPAPPTYALLQSSGLPEHAANELVDPDGEGGRLGTGWTAGLGLLWDDVAGAWVRDDVNGPAVSPACPGLKFGLIEGNMKGGAVTTLWVRGYDGTSDYSSDRVDVGSQTPNDAGWTLDVQQDIDISTGKGQSQSVVCTVYVHQIEFVPVNP